MTASAAGDAVINVAGLLGEAPGARRDVSLDELRLDLGEGLDAAVPVVVQARIARTNRGVLVNGRVRTSLADTCVRCLEPVSFPIDAAIDEEVLPSIELATGVAVDTSAEPEALRLTDHHELDLGRLVREAIVLAAPLAPLCRPDCRGLCPECGADLNAGDHQHPDGPGDPRLARLAELEVDE